MKVKSLSHVGPSAVRDYLPGVVGPGEAIREHDGQQPSGQGHGDPRQSCGCRRGGPAHWGFQEGDGENHQPYGKKRPGGQRLTSRCSPIASTASSCPDPSGHQRARKSSNTASNAPSSGRSRWRGLALRGTEAAQCRPPPCPQGHRWKNSEERRPGPCQSRAASRPALTAQSSPGSVDLAPPQAPRSLFSRRSAPTRTHEACL